MTLHVQQRLAANIADLAQFDRLENVLARLEFRQPVPARARVNPRHLVPRVEIYFQALVHRTNARANTTDAPGCNPTTPYATA